MVEFTVQLRRQNARRAAAFAEKGLPGLSSVDAVVNHAVACFLESTGAGFLAVSAHVRTALKVRGVHVGDAVAEDVATDLNHLFVAQADSLATLRAPKA